MKYLAAYVLLALGGNTSPDEAAISKLLSSVGIESESERVSKLVSELSGKNVWEVIEAGRAKLAQVPSGRGREDMSLANLTQSRREELIVSLAALLISDCKVEISEENLNTVISSSGNTVPSYLPD